MAEIEKLPVGKVLDRLRRTDVRVASKTEHLDEKTKALEEEILRLRAARHRLERDQSADSTMVSPRKDPAD
jgi:hypothetical protein